MILWQKYRNDENINFAAKICENYALYAVDYIKALSVAYRAAWEMKKTRLPLTVHRTVSRGFSRKSSNE
jgi:hypothetical protein